MRRSCASSRRPLRAALEARHHSGGRRLPRRDARRGAITTLGRGGSDLTAIALGDALGSRRRRHLHRRERRDDGRSAPHRGRAYDRSRRRRGDGRTRRQRRESHAREGRRTRARRPRRRTSIKGLRSATSARRSTTRHQSIAIAPVTGITALRDVTFFRVIQGRDRRRAARAMLDLEAVSAASPNADVSIDMINVNDAGVFFVVRYATTSTRARRTRRPQPRAPRAAALREALDRRRRHARHAGRHGTRRAARDARPTSKSFTRPTRTSRFRCSSPKKTRRAPNKRFTITSVSGFERTPTNRGMKSSLAPACLHGDDHAVRRTRATSTPRKPRASRSYLVAAGNDGLVVSGTTGESPALDDRRETRALRRRSKTRVGDARHRHRRNVRKQHAAFGRADEARAKRRASTRFSRSCRITTNRRKTACSRTSARSPRRRRCRSSSTTSPAAPARTCCRRRCSNSRAATRTSPASKSRAATSRNSPRSCATAARGLRRLVRRRLPLSCRRSRSARDGLVSVAAHLCAREFRAMADAFARRRRDGGDAIHAISRRCSRRSLRRTSPIPVKWAMNELGFALGPCRSPLGVMPPDLSRRLRPLLEPFSRARDARAIDCDRPRLPRRRRRHAPMRSTGSSRSPARHGHALVVTLGTEMACARAARRALSRRIVNACALSLCDTVGILLAARCAAAPLRERVTGVDLIDRSAKRSRATATCGCICSAAKPGIAARAAAVLQARYPGLDRSPARATAISRPPTTSAVAATIARAARTCCSPGSVRRARNLARRHASEGDGVRRGNRRRRFVRRPRGNRRARADALAAPQSRMAVSAAPRAGALAAATRVAAFRVARTTASAFDRAFAPEKDPTGESDDSGRRHEHAALPADQTGAETARARCGRTEQRRT